MTTKNFQPTARGQVLPFPGRARTDLEQTEALLKQAEASARSAVARFSSCRDAIDWARRFRERSELVADSADLDEMVRLRDALAREWAERCAQALKIG